MPENPEDGKAENGEFSLGRLLTAADLLRYESKLRNELKLRHAGDIQYVEEQDLSGIGMSRPEQKRLRKEYERLYPSGFVGKLKRVFGRGEGEKKETQSNGNREEEDQHVIPLEKISLCKELGHGEFGSVWQATWKGGPNGAELMQVAVKCVSPEKLVASSSSFLQEAAIMTRMRHECVVRLYGVVLDTKRVMMVSELATCGSLLECLHKPALRDSFPVHVLCDYAEQIARGMAYLESQRLIHRDLAARNVLVFSPKKVKISDFGLSRSLGVGEDYYRSEFNPNLKLPIAWCAPECINFLKFTSASDVWAYGVTLWELFTYGQMPWNGMNGAQILNAVDRERRQLSRPVHCPEDLYETMKECWTHSPVHRPTFADIVVQFPERLPQTVRAIREMKDGITDHLQFNTNDLITVIDKTPPLYPDGFFWFGSLRNGRTGLFRPADTVAHLGAEQPASVKVLTTGCVGGTLEKKEEKEKKSTKKSKEEEREKRKALISEPVGDVRHTCHVGIDGTAFGLLQLDKKEAVPSPSSPSISHVSSPPVQLRSENGREGVTLRETKSLRDVGPITVQADPKSPPNVRAPSQPPLPPKASRASVQPTAPPLTASAANSLNKDMQQMFDELNSSLRSMETTASSTAPLLPEERRQKPVSAVYARPVREQPSPASTSDSILESELRHLERDLTDFSISTLNDFSDTRPLISASPTPAQGTAAKGAVHSSSTSSTKTAISGVRPMTDEELARWHEKEAREHKKAEMRLLEEKKRVVPCSIRIEENGTSGESFTSRQSPGSNPMEWSPEAQEAYKLLVECGTDLKRTPSPVMSPTSTIDRKERRVTVIENKPSPTPPPRPATPPRAETRAEPAAAENVTSYSPQKKIHYIETKLLDGPARGLSPTKDRPSPPVPPKATADNRQPPGLPPKMRQVRVTMDGRVNYDNLNGIGAGRVPPPVPPKPKVSFRTPSASPPPPTVVTEKDSPGCAPSIARSTLFSANKKEEIVKF